MINFWNWLKLTGKINDGADGNYAPLLKGNEPPKQMLIGYMVEYLYCANKHKDIAYGIIDIPINIFNSKGNINEIYKYLEKEIRKIK